MKSFKKKIPITLAVLSLAGVLLVLDSLPDNSLPVTTGTPAAQVVTVLSSSPAQRQLSVSTVGITQSRWQTELNATTNGNLTELNTDIEPGSLIEKGEFLAQIDPTHISAEVEQAKSHLASTRLKLEREKHEQTVAKKILPRNVSTAFARREPQVAAASAEVHHAEQALASVRQRLIESRVVAPFDAVILKRFASPAQHVDTGTPLYVIASSHSVDIEVSLSKRLWQRLGGKVDPNQISVVDRDNNTWPVKLRYIAPEFDAATRQRQLVLAVENPFQQPKVLLPLQQVKVIFNITPDAPVHRLPISVLTLDGAVWCVNDDNKLVLEPIIQLNEDGNQVWFQFTKEPERSRNIVQYPLLTMLPGSDVEPTYTNSNSANNSYANNSEEAQ
ncbi:efflux RND transporter periplasmic adaptor subunit [Photobacterium alginatilyticum]|uniref:efflux RND transporter periplasmic adaptor subunit n=1 Tax=Photobacterium alginatilyticum TaxID=1775171 RepID=UPI004067C025